MKKMFCLISTIIAFLIVAISTNAESQYYFCETGDVNVISNQPCISRVTYSSEGSENITEGQIIRLVEGLYPSGNKVSSKSFAITTLESTQEMTHGTSILRKVYRMWSNLSSETKNKILETVHTTGLSETYITPEGHFIMHYTTDTSTNDSTTLSYVQNLGSYLERSWFTYVNTLGFSQPASGTINIYIKDLNDYNPAQTGFLLGSLWMDFDSCKVILGACTQRPAYETKFNAAHEMFHAIQTASVYDYGEEDWIAEGTANWGADVVYDDLNGYFDYLSVPGYNPPLVNPDYPINKNYIDLFTGDPHVYSTILYWKYFSEHYGTDGSGSACYNKCGDPNCGADIMRTLMEKTKTANGIQAVGNALSTRSKTWQDSFMNWLMTNYLKQLGNPYYGGIYDYCEDEETDNFGAKYPEQYILRTYSLANNQNITAPSDSVNAWAADYIQVFPSSNVGKIRIKFNGQDSGILGLHDFYIRAVPVKNNGIGIIDDILPGSNNDVTAEIDNNANDNITFIISGRDYGGGYTIEFDGYNDCTDSDHDGYSGKSMACPIGTDCNDANANINPGKAEVCNNIDDNCNGQVDEGFNNDGDGYTTCNGDCNDNNAAVNPGAQEICGNGIDDNCNGQQNEGCTCTNGATRPCGTDAGRCEFGTQTCSGGAWGACVGGVTPRAETCNNEDDDCDGQTDELFCGGSNYYPDQTDRPTGIVLDYINSVSIGHKAVNAWYAVDIDNDGRIEFYKLLTEPPLRTWFYCNARDDRSKRVSDITNYFGSSFGCTSADDRESEKSKSYCDTAYEYSYVDQTFSTPQSSLYSTDMFCNVQGFTWGWNRTLLQSPQGENYLILNCGIDFDCPPDQYCKKPTLSNPTTYYCASRCGNGVCETGENCPSDSQGAEVCDSVDNNCNGVVDDGLAISCSSNSNCPASGCYQGTYRNYACTNPGTCKSKCEFTASVTDNDGDGYDTQCDNDCNDSDPNVHPGAIERCNGKDDNCDAVLPADELDKDGDGVSVCQGDCNDGNPNVRPGINESCSDNIDNDCNGLVNETCCTNECASGESVCEGGSVKTCGNYDSDFCLEWPTSQPMDFCGNSTYDIWSYWYCSGRDVAKNRTAELRGCHQGSCFYNSSIEFETINCSFGCANSLCIQMAGDINGDCIVNIFDLAAVGLAYSSTSGGQNWSPSADINNDGEIDIFDLATVGLNYGKSC